MNMNHGENAQNVKRWELLSQCVPSKRSTHVVDIGANPLEVPSYQSLLDAKLCTVFGFEPQEDAYKELQDSKSANEVYFPTALGSGRKETLNVYASSGLSSLYKLDARTTELLGRSQRGATLVEAVEMKTRRLDDIDEIDALDLIKIDTQGAEAIIMSNGAKKLANVVAAITEIRFFPMYEDEPPFDDQIKLLRGFGLYFHKILFTKSAMVQSSRGGQLKKRRLRTQLLDGDGVFIKDLRDPDAISDEQLSHLAIIADAMLQSYDVTLRCLDILAARRLVIEKEIDAYLDLLPSAVKRD